MDDREDKIIVAVDDMFFAAKISGTAAGIGKTIERVNSAEAIRQAVEERQPSLVIIDLNAAKFDAIALIEWVKAQFQAPPVFIIGFLSHIQVDLKHRAEEAGCDLVLPRSVFSQKLVEILSGKLTARPS
jgi:CheY-like chemotaxis protein